MPHNDNNTPPYFCDPMTGSPPPNLQKPPLTPTSLSQGYSSGWSRESSRNHTPQPEKLLSSLEERSGVINVSVDLTMPPAILPEFQSMRDAYEALTPEEKKIYPVETIAFGDAHANTLRMVYLRVLTGVLDVTPDQYLALKRLYDAHAALLIALDKFTVPAAATRWTNEYKTAWSAVKNNIAAFNAIIHNFSVHHHLLTIEIGDVLADRREQDAFTLSLFDHLNNQKENEEDEFAKYVIIYSNHDEQFMLQYQKGFLDILKDKGKLGGGMRDGADRSLVNLGIALKHKVIPEDVISKQVEEAYKPYLKMGYAVPMNGKSVDRFFHAPVDSLQVKSLADFFKVAYENASVEDVINTINLINVKFKQKLDCVNDEKINDLVLPKLMLDAIHRFQKENPGKAFEPIFLNSNYAAHGFLWGRPGVLESTVELLKEIDFTSGERAFWRIENEEYRMKLLLPDKSECLGSYNHGHVGEGREVNIGAKAAKRYNNLESNLGKYADIDQGVAPIYYCGTHQAALALLAKRVTPKQTPKQRYSPSPEVVLPPVFCLPPSAANQRLDERETNPPTPKGCPGAGFFASRRSVKSVQLTPESKTKEKRSFCFT
ncbi:MAG: hypothetical protein NTZ67_06035 [Gammaproteobacteria bacterium]|nr:hypothetical protein [Gammaproteobacteria bacterium]